MNVLELFFAGSLLVLGNPAAQAKRLRVTRLKRVSLKKEVSISDLAPINQSQELTAQIRVFQERAAHDAIDHF